MATQTWELFHGLLEKFLVSKSIRNHSRTIGYKCENRGIMSLLTARVGFTLLVVIQHILSA